MKNIFFLIFASMLILSCGSAKSDYKDDIREIKRVMEMQEKAWSNNNIESFMQGYWRSDDLRFYGSTGITKGWDRVLENYKVRYPNKDFTGTLKFEIDNISKISDDSYYVMGKFDLDRKAGDANGVFMLVFKKIDGQWKIIADMSC